LRRFLVVYDYGMGGLWGVVEAPSRDEILSPYPELVIVDERPDWMSDDRWERLHADTYDLHDPPRGILRAVIKARERS
jgi:hypothetical protein